ncbi:OmpA family protein [Paracoccaceae bacterium]|jgi:chemotaxis protein MotB|nr:OmpA family protein [Paracoccaceae bacterium]
MAEEALDDEEQDAEDCPKCPPQGAPAWMATFADMATLLMAFFVLILSFAEFNVPKFKQISGSLKEAFGVQKVVPVVEQPKGTTVIELNFSPNPDPSISTTLRQDTTELQKPEINKKTEDGKSPDGTGDDKKNQSDYDGAGGEGAEALDATELANQLKKAIDTGEVTVETLGENVVINFPEEKTSDEDVSTMIAETLEALNEAREKSGASESEVLFGGIEQELEKLAAAIDESLPQDGEGQGGSSSQESEEEKIASRTTEELTVALKEQIDQGLIEVEQREGKVFVTVGSGGAFPSGTADLTGEAQRIIDRIALSAMSPDSSIKVTGHTDDVPISNGQFRDNWDLGAGRAASVVQAIQNTGLIAGDRLEAVSKGEMEPVAENTTASGREKNRRIEIEISYEN